MLGQQRRMHRRRTLLALQLRGGQEPAEAAPTLLVAHQERKMLALGQRDLGAEDRAHPDGATGPVEGRACVESRPVGQRQSLLPEFGGAAGQRLGRRRAVQEGEVAMHV